MDNEKPKPFLDRTKIRRYICTNGVIHNEGVIDVNDLKEPLKQAIIEISSLPTLTRYGVVKIIEKWFPIIKEKR